MKLTPKFCLFLLIIVFIPDCTSNKNTNTNSTNQAANSANSTNSNSVKDDADELGMIINLPFHPEEAVWREETLGKTSDNRVPGPTDKKLVAVLRFLKEDTAKVVAQAEKVKAATPETISPEKWFPAELIAQSQMSGDETLKGSSYPANDFYNPPYSDGKITRIEGTDYFVLELFAK